MTWVAVAVAGTGLIGGLLSSQTGKNQVAAANQSSQADRDFAREMYGRNLQDSRANQTTDFGSLTWAQDPKTGQWTQSNTMNPAEQARLGDARQIAADRMASAKGLSANFAQGAPNYDAIGLGKLASAMGVPGGGTSDSSAAGGSHVVGQPGWTRQNPLIGMPGFSGGQMGQMGQMGQTPGPMGIGSAGGNALGQGMGGPPPQGPPQGQPQGPPQTPPGNIGGMKPYTPAPITPPAPAAPPPAPAAPAPAAPAAPTISPETTAALRGFLSSGQNVLTPEMYDYYHGDDLLKAVKQYDPNAKWTTTTLGGGEGGEGGTGKRLDYDPRIMAQLLAGGQ